MAAYSSSEGDPDYPVEWIEYYPSGDGYREAQFYPALLDPSSALGHQHPKVILREVNRHGISQAMGPIFQETFFEAARAAALDREFDTNENLKAIVARVLESLNITLDNRG